MATMTVQFEGICCHIQPPAGSPITVGRRAVMPVVHDHIGYIEVFTNDFAEAANPNFTFTGPYTRDNSSYRRTVIQNAKVELLDITSTTFTTLPSFFQRIPSLQAVEPRFTQIRPELLQPTIPTDNVAAYFDINFGLLSSGPSEHFRTVFQPQQNWPVRHLGQWVNLEVETSVTTPRLQVTDLATGAVRVLVLKDGSDLVTVGNQTVDDILGQPNNTGHFAHYYELSPVALPDAPEPKIGQGLGVGCADTHWP